MIDLKKTKRAEKRRAPKNECQKQSNRIEHEKSSSESESSDEEEDEFLAESGTSIGDCTDTETHVPLTTTRRRRCTTYKEKVYHI